VASAGLAVRAAFTAFAREFDLRDAHFYGGLLLFGFGGAQLSVPWTCMLVGAVLAVVGLLPGGKR
jgi:hypothetical protein